MVFVIVAMQRSGTLLLTKTINSHPNVVCMEEVFHPQAPDNESFAQFCQLRASTKDLSYLSGRVILFYEFLDHTAKTKHVENVGFNVKYGSCHQLDGDWKDYTRRPALFDLMKSWNGRIIHLVRRNVFLQALSLIKAQQTGIWHLPLGRPAISRAVHVRVDELTFRMDSIRKLVSVFSGYLDDDPNVLKVYYEDMIKSGKFQPEIVESVSDFLGIRLKPDAKPQLSRTSLPDWREDVVNWQEVECAVPVECFRDLGDHRTP
jgi:LPS sulfotransferase NodH